MSEFERQYEMAYGRMQRISVLNTTELAGLPTAVVQIAKFYEGGPYCFVARDGRDFSVCSIAEHRQVSSAIPSLEKQSGYRKLHNALDQYLQERITKNGESPPEYFVTYGHRRARCGMDLLELDDQRLQVTFTELPDNRGRSVTNAIEELAELLMLWRDLPLSRLRFVEHYPERPRAPETFDEVTFKLTEPLPKLPIWRRLTPAQVQYPRREGGR